MKILSINFLTCAVKTCRASSNSFPLHPKDAELVQDDVELNAQLLVNILPRIDWPALCTTATEVSREPRGKEEKKDKPRQNEDGNLANYEASSDSLRSHRSRRQQTSSKRMRRCSRTCTTSSSRPR